MHTGLNKNLFYIVFFLIHIKMSKDSSARYYQEYKERLQKNDLRKVPKSFLRRNRKKRQFGRRELYKNLPDHEKQNLVE